ncbi:MAG: nucleotidyltransferase family protein [Mycobacteriales bacterium]
MIADSRLRKVAARIAAVPGVIGVALGGSRARGTHGPDSDLDLGLYYRPELAVGELSALAADLSGPGTQITEPGGWGPWVDGGGWLVIEGTAVDWIYRDLDRVRAAWVDARGGRYAFHLQAGHPLGFADFAYAGELASAVLLADPSGELAALQASMRAGYPPRLAAAIVDGLWEAGFLIDGARKAVGRADAAYIAGCLFRAVGLCAHAVHASAGSWLLNEKGAVRTAAALPTAPRDFAARAGTLFAATGGTPEHLAATLDAAESLLADVRAACAGGAGR